MIFVCFCYFREFGPERAVVLSIEFSFLTSNGNSECYDHIRVEDFGKVQGIV